MSAPLRAQDADEPSEPALVRPAPLRVPEPDARAAAARAEAEAAVAEVMALEARRAQQLADRAQRARRPRLRLREWALIALTLALVYFVQVRPDWMILPIPANESMFQYYRESWRTALELRREEVLEARLRHDGLGALRRPLAVPRTHVRARPGAMGYLQAGDDEATCVLKSLAFSAWTIQLGGR